MKVRETIVRDGGLGGGRTYSCVRELKKGEEAPPGAEIVPDDAPVHDWAEEIE